MKIRTDFVTNSSSCTTAEIMIENALLLEILESYKDRGTFDGIDPYFGVGSYEINEDGYITDYANEYLSETKTPAFFLYEHLWGEGSPKVEGCPKSLDKVLSNIISIMDNNDDEYDRDLYEQMCEELIQRHEEIKHYYRKVLWKFKDETEPTEGEIYKWEFNYDPKKGEKFQVEYYKGDEDDEVENNEE